MPETSTPPGDPAPPTNPAPTAPPPADPSDELGDAGQKAIDAERKARRDAERKLRDQTRELETLRQQSMSEQERAVAQAREEGKVEGRRELGVARVDDAVRVAAAGREADVDALLEGIDRARFLDDDGQPDTVAIGKWVDRVAPPKDDGPLPGFVDLGQGVRGGQGSAKDPLLASVEKLAGIR